MTWPSERQLSDREQHAGFVELCALYSTGSLSSSELDQLEEHLSGCSPSRALLADYARLVRHGIPHLAQEDTVVPVSGFDRELAESRELLLARAGQREDERRNDTVAPL